MALPTHSIPAPWGHSCHVPGHLMKEFYLPCNSHTTLTPLQKQGRSSPSLHLPSRSKEPHMQP